jgi:hypothetical protein
MAIYHGTQKVTPYKGDYGAVNIYNGTQKVAGWKHESKTGTLLSFDGTYNDRIESLTVKGKTNQVVTVRLPNLYNKITNALVIGNVDGADGTDDNGTITRVRTPNKIPVNASTQYIASVGNNSVYLPRQVSFYTASSVYISSLLTNSSPFTTPANCGLIRFTFMRVDNAVIDSSELSTINNLVQIELGAVATFDSPSPDYPSPITGVQPSKVTVNGADYPLSLPTLYNLPDGTQSTAELISGAGTRNIGVKVYDGSTDETWGFSTTNNNRAYITIPDLYASAYTVNDAFCSHFKYNSNIYSDANNEQGFVTNNHTLLIRFGSSSSVNSLDVLKTWLSANPVTVLYKLATPTPISLTPMTIPTIPIHTDISADGAEITAQVKVVDTTL